MVLNIVLFRKGNIYSYSLSMLTYMFFQFFFLFFLYSKTPLFITDASLNSYIVFELCFSMKKTTRMLKYVILLNKSFFFLSTRLFCRSKNQNCRKYIYIYFSCVKHFPCISILQVMHLVFRKPTCNFICR